MQQDKNLDNQGWLGKDGNYDPTHIHAVVVPNKCIDSDLYVQEYKKFCDREMSKGQRPFRPSNYVNSKVMKSAVYVRHYCQSVAINEPEFSTEIKPEIDSAEEDVKRQSPAPKRVKINRSCESYQENMNQGCVLANFAKSWLRVVDRVADARVAVLARQVINGINTDTTTVSVWMSKIDTSYSYGRPLKSIANTKFSDNSRELFQLINSESGEAFNSILISQFDKNQGLGAHTYDER